MIELNLIDKVGFFGYILREDEKVFQFYEVLNLAFYANSEIGRIMSFRAQFNSRVSNGWLPFQKSNILFYLF